MTESRYGFELNSTLEQDMAKTSPINPVLKAFEKIDLLNSEKDNQLKTLEKEVEKLKKIEEESYKDALTGCYVRKYWEDFSKKFNPETDRISMVFVDIDDLKQVNDSPQGGHAAGDKYIQKTANFLKEVFKDPEDKIIRMGGDEFLVLSQKGKNSHDSYVKFKEFVEKSFDSERLKSQGLNFSYGVAHFTNKLDRNVQDTYERSDNKMYTDKFKRKNEKPVLVNA